MHAVIKRNNVRMIILIAFFDYGFVLRPIKNRGLFEAREEVNSRPTCFTLNDFGDPESSDQFNFSKLVVVGVLRVMPWSEFKTLLRYS